VKIREGEVTLLVWFTPYINILADEKGPYTIFKKRDGTLHLGEINPTTPQADIALKRAWARAAKMRYEETPFAKLGGDTDIGDKIFTKG